MDSEKDEKLEKYLDLVTRSNQLFIKRTSIIDFERIRVTIIIKIVSIILKHAILVQGSQIASHKSDGGHNAITIVIHRIPLKEAVSSSKEKE